MEMSIYIATFRVLHHIIIWYDYRSFEGNSASVFSVNGGVCSSKTFLILKLTEPYLLHGAGSFLRSWWLLSWSRNSPHFMKHEGSLPRLQELAIVPIMSQNSPIHAPHPTSWRSILILSSHLLLCLPSGLFPSGFPTITLFVPLPRTCYMLGASHSSRFDHPNNVWWAVQITMLLVMADNAPLIINYVVTVDGNIWTSETFRRKRTFSCLV